MPNHDCRGRQRKLRADEGNCEEFASKSIYPVRYGYEEKPGLPHVRNKAVQIARQFADAIAFVDDDEVPSPGWLKYLAGVPEIIRSRCRRGASRAVVHVQGSALGSRREIL